MSRKFRFWVCALLVLILVFTTMSCSYKKFTLREGYSHFSFAYPANYENVLIDTIGTYTDAAFQRSMLEEQYEDSWIGLTIREPSPKSGQIDAKTSIEYDIENFSNNDNFQLLERSQVTVAGIKAEKFVCAFTRYPNWEYVEDTKDIKEASTIFWWGVSFDYNGLIWDIYMGSIEKTAESDKQIFDHIIETFRILK